MEDMEDNESWKVWRKSVLFQLERLNSHMETQTERTAKMEARLSVQEVKTTVLALLAGAIPGLAGKLFKI